MICSAARTHSHLPRGSQGALCTARSSRLFIHPIARHHHRCCPQGALQLYIHVPNIHTRKYINYNRCKLTSYQYGVKGVPMRTKPYRNERIVTVIRNLFFAGGSSSYAHRYDYRFPRYRSNDGVVVREVPVPMLALVATAVSVTHKLRLHTNLKSQLYAAIYEWRTGVRQASEFSTDAYLDAYNGHIGTLKHIEVERPAAFHTMMAHVYTLARYLCRILHHEHS